MVSVCIGRIDGRVLHIELLLMSCRVLKRDMEYAMLDCLVRQCADRGITSIRGYYYPTKKNGMVRELYGDLGFTKLSQADDGASEWELMTAGYVNKNRYIEIV